MSDIALLVRLAYKTAEGARTACGEYDELTREVVGLHYVLNRLEREARKPDSFLNRPGETYKQELEPLSSRCKHILTQLDIILVKYNALSERERSVRKLWKQVRFGTGAVADVADLRSKITSCTASLSLFLNLVSLGTIGEVERKMNQAGGDLADIKIAVNGITARLSVTAGRERSVLTAYTNDDKDAWRELRRGLVKDGFRGSLVRKHMKTIMAYIKELGSRGVLDRFDELGCREGSYMPGRHDEIYQSDREYQATVTTRNQKTTGSSSNQAQPIHPEDESKLMSSAASSDSSISDNCIAGRPLPSYRQPYVESADETASEDDQLKTRGTASSKGSYLHTSHSADDMMGQEPSDVDTDTRNLLSLDVREELSQLEAEVRRKYKQEDDKSRLAEAWTTSNGNQAQLKSRTGYEANGYMGGSHRLFSIDRSRAARLLLYQNLLGVYQVPDFIADNTVIYTLANTRYFNAEYRRRQLLAINEFTARALSLWTPIGPSQKNIPSLVMPGEHQLGLALTVQKRLIIEQCHNSCLRLKERFDDCFRRRILPRMNVRTAEYIDPERSRESQLEQIDLLCAAFMVELIHHQIAYCLNETRASVEDGWTMIFMTVVQDVEDWVHEYDWHCSTTVHNLRNEAYLEALLE